LAGEEFFLCVSVMPLITFIKELPWWGMQHTVFTLSLARVLT
jgi:hypothetical protein